MGLFCQIFVLGAPTGQFWQNEAKMINLFNTERTRGTMRRRRPTLIAMPVHLAGHMDVDALD